MSNVMWAVMVSGSGLLVSGCLFEGFDDEDWSEPRSEMSEGNEPSEANEANEGSARDLEVIEWRLPSSEANEQSEATRPSVEYVVEDAWMEGDMRTVGRFAGDAYQVDYSRTRISIHTGERGGDHSGWAMIRLTTAVVEEGFEDDAWAPENFEGSVGTPPPVSGLGCSGPSHGNWDFDGSARVLNVRSERGGAPDSRLIHFEAEYPNAQWARGSFLLRPR